jgi:ABC-2 type transport system ATP-binding protein
MFFMEKAITTKGLSKEYSGVFRVKDLDLQIRQGEVYGFLGPNGAGKSTTMKMILGLVRPTRGSVELFGQRLTEKSRIDILRQTGSLIESPAYYGHLTGMENMRIIQKLMDLPEKNIRKALSIVRLDNQRNKKVKYYSLGMKQRLGIAMALARFPKLLVLDEPTNGLDPAGIEEIRELICSLPAQYGMTVMISSHILSEIDRMATAAGIINKGELVFQGSMEELRAKSSHSIVMRVRDRERAAGLLSDYSPKMTPDGELAFEHVSDDAVARINSRLVENGMPVFRIEERRKSLEEIFLDLTGKAAAL